MIRTIFFNHGEHGECPFLVASTEAGAYDRERLAELLLAGMHQENSFLRCVTPELTFFLYHGDEAIDVSLLLPDANPLFRRFDGKKIFFLTLN